MQKLLILVFLAGFIITSGNSGFTQEKPKQESQLVSAVQAKENEESKASLELKGKISPFEKKINDLQNQSAHELQEALKEIKKDLREEYMRDIDRTEYYFYAVLSIGVGLGTLVLLILTFIGRREIVSFIRTNIRDVTEEQGGVLSKQELAYLIEDKSKDTIDKLIEEVSTKAKAKILEIDNLFEKYEKELIDLKKERLDADKPLSEDTKKTLGEYTVTLKELKEEKDYTADDWFYSGVEKRRNNDFENAIKYYTEAIKLDPKFVRAYNNRGISYAKQGKYEEAIADYTKAIKLYPQNTLAYLNLIELYIRNNEYDKALITVENIKNLELDIRDMAVILHFECIASKMLNKDTSQCDKKYDESLKEDFDLHDWDFEPIDNWLNKENIYEDKKMYIEDVIAKLKLHKK